MVGNNAGHNWVYFIKQTGLVYKFVPVVNPTRPTMQANQWDRVKKYVLGHHA